jgi:hypothetical protein
MDSLNLDPEFEVPIRIRGFDTKNWKNLQLKKFNIFLMYLIPYLSLGLKREHPALQNMKFSLLAISIFVGHFALLDPDSESDPLT